MKNSLKKFFDPLLKIISSIAISLVTAWIIPIITTVIGLITVGLYNFIYKPNSEQIIIAITVAACIVLISVLALFIVRTPNFKWVYTIKKEICSLKLENRTATYKDKVEINIKNQKLFNSKMLGSYDWGNAERIDSFQCNCNHAQLKLLDENNKEIAIDNNNLPDKINYMLNFDGNWTPNESIEILFDLGYNPQNFERNLYIEVVRPTKILELSLVVPESVSIQNVRIHKFKLYGDKLNVNTYSNDINHLNTAGDKLSGKKDETTGYTTYEYRIRYPKLMSRYEITWELT